MADNKLSILITADGTQANAAINEVSRHASSMGGSLASSLSSAIPVAQTAVAAIAGIGLAAVGVGVRLYEITKTAADFGSQIYDASKQTGLGAEALSSLKAAAETSGSSLETVTRGVAKFAKEYKGDSQDLQAELGKVFKQIQDAPAGFQKLQIAQETFGKSGKELIGVIDSFDGDLEGLITRMREMGVTIDDDGAAKADAFGDQMDLLGMQVAGVGRTIGTAFMPQFTSMAVAVSDFFTQNQSQISSFATRTATVFENLIRGIGLFVQGIRENETAIRLGLAVVTGGASEAAIQGGSWFANTVSMPRKVGSYEGGREMRFPGVDDIDSTTGKGKGGGARRPPRESDDQFRRFFRELGFEVVRTFGKAINDGSPHTFGGAADIRSRGKSADEIFMLMVKSLEKGYRVVDERVPVKGIKQTGPHVHVENAKTSLQKESVFGSLGFTPDQVAYLKELDKQRLGKATGKAGFESFTQKASADATKLLQDEENEAARIFEEWLRAEREASDARISIRKEEGNLAEEILREQLRLGLISEAEYTERVSQMRIDMLLEERDELAEQTQTRQTIQDLAKLDLAIATAKLKKENDIADAIQRQREEHEAIINSQRKANQRPSNLKTRTKKGNPWLDGMDEATGSIRSMDDVIGQLGQTASDVFMQMGQGLGNMLQSWVLMGDQADVSMNKMVASVLAGVAAQAATLAIFHVAMGLAALTPWGAAMYGPAPLHFKAAAVWGAVAVGAAIGGRLVAGDSFQSGSGASGGSSSSGSGRSNSSSQELDPYTRSTANAYMSGTNTTNTRLAVALEAFNAKVNAARPGDVFMTGMRANRGAVLNQATEDARANAAAGVKFGRALNFK